MNLLERCKEYCDEEKLISPRDELLLAVSGGPDSLALLDIFDRLQEEWELKIAVFHLDHALRQSSAAEAEFVAEECHKRGIECWQERIDVEKARQKRGGSLEDTARDIRLSLLYKYAREHDMDAVVFGHHADDRAETVLFNLMRGAGMRGLGGISPLTHFRGVPFVRPLLIFRKEELERYCQDRSLEPRIDSSNFSTDYDRNRIRQELIPYLENNFNPELISVLNSTAELIREEDRYLQGLAEDFFAGEAEVIGQHRIDLEIASLDELDPVLRRRLWRAIIRRLLGSTEGFYRDHFEIIEKIVEEHEDERGGRDFHLPGGITVREEYGIISFRDKFWQQKNQQSGEFSSVVSEPCELELPTGDFLRFQQKKLPDNWKEIARKENTALLDNEKISWPLKVRNRRDGDRFQPLGMSGTKKIKDFFIDEKVPGHKRDRIPLIVDSADFILWVAGFRCDDRFKIKSSTSETLLIDYLPQGEE